MKKTKICHGGLIQSELNPIYKVKNFRTIKHYSWFFYKMNGTMTIIAYEP